MMQKGLGLNVIHVLIRNELLTGKRIPEAKSFGKTPDRKTQVGEVGVKGIRYLSP